MSLLPINLPPISAGSSATGGLFTGGNVIVMPPSGGTDDSMGNLGNILNLLGAGSLTNGGYEIQGSEAGSIVGIGPNDNSVSPYEQGTLAVNSSPGNLLPTVSKIPPVYLILGAIVALVLLKKFK